MHNARKNTHTKNTSPRREGPAQISRLSSFPRHFHWSPQKKQAVAEDGDGQQVSPETPLLLYTTSATTPQALPAPPSLHSLPTHFPEKTSRQKNQRVTRYFSREN